MIEDTSREVRNLDAKIGRLIDEKIAEKLTTMNEALKRIEGDMQAKVGRGDQTDAILKQITSLQTSRESISPAPV
jgi:hypothetical protein